jgi:5'-deoxynucleotidase YfbR-like HD superfamily hydrolase
MSPPTPTSILVRDPETNRSWYLDTAAPTADMVTLGQLGCGLESIRRFCGYTTRPITVAEHSMRVGRFARALAESTADTELVYMPGSRLRLAAADLVGLIHDTPEAITGRGDVLRPAKTDADREAEARAYAAIVEHLFSPLGPLWHLSPTGMDRVRQALADVAEVVHTADNLALYYEAMLWQPGAADWVPAVVRDPLPDVMLPLVWPREGERWSDAVRSTCAEVAAAARAL